MKDPNWPQYTGVRAPVATESSPASEPDWERYTGVAASDESEKRTPSQFAEVVFGAGSAQKLPMQQSAFRLEPPVVGTSATGTVAIYGPSADLAGEASGPTVAGLCPSRSFTSIELGPDFWQKVTPDALREVFPDPMDRLKAARQAFDDHLIQSYSWTYDRASNEERVDVERLPVDLVFRETEPCR